MNTKKIIIIVYLLSIVTLVLFKVQSYNKEDRLPTNKYISIMIKDSNGEYHKSMSDTLPAGMVLNEQLSYCVNNSVMKYDESKLEILLESSGSDECYMYFDEKEYGEFSATVLNNNGGASEIRSKGTPSFNIIATTDEGMFAAQDDYGTSYYFRGAVENNWVSFGGFYWRIIRVNGDGSVRMIYSGNTESGPVTTGDDTNIGSDRFNLTAVILSDENTFSQSPEGVGYVYTEGELHGTTTDSNIKSLLDNWYEDNLENVSDSNIINTVFCIDRTGYIDSEFTTPLIESSFTGDEIFISYGTRYRLEHMKNPSLNCSHQNDILSLKVGLISADEISMAGALNWKDNENYYLYTGNDYWGISPYNFPGAGVYKVGDTGKLSTSFVNIEYALRPVITIRDDASVISGLGTVSEPYLVQ